MESTNKGLSKRERYAADTEFREKCKEAARAYYNRKKNGLPPPERKKRDAKNLSENKSSIRSRRAYRALTDEEKTVAIERVRAYARKAYERKLSKIKEEALKYYSAKGGHFTDIRTYNQDLKNDRQQLCKKLLKLKASEKWGPIIDLVLREETTPLS